MKTELVSWKKFRALHTTLRSRTSRSDLADCVRPAALFVDDLGDLFLLCADDASGNHARVHFPLKDVWHAKSMAENMADDTTHFASPCPFLRIYFQVEDHFAARRERFLYLESPEVWSDDGLINDEDDMRAYWIAATLPEEVYRTKRDYDLRDELYWLKNFAKRKNNAIFHMNGREYFKNVDKIKAFLHVSRFRRFDPKGRKTQVLAKLMKFFGTTKDIGSTFNPFNTILSPSFLHAV